MAKKKDAGEKPSGRKARAKKPTAAETVEATKGLTLLLGDNGPPTKDVMYHYETILGLMDKAATAASKVSDAKKKAKEAGVDVAALMTVKKLMRLEPMDLSATLRQQVMMLRELGSPIQMSLYETAYGTIEDQAKAEGWADGTNGRNLNIARWPEGAPGHVEYSRRWNDAQAELVGKMGGSATAH